jgi:hypothetical protein
MLNAEDRVQLVIVLDDHARTHLCGGNRHKRKTPSSVAGMGVNPDSCFVTLDAAACAAFI